MVSFELSLRFENGGLSVFNTATSTRLHVGSLKEAFDEMNSSFKANVREMRSHVDDASAIAEHDEP